MARSKKFSESSTDCSKSRGRTSRRSSARPLTTGTHVPFPRSSCEDHFCLVEPQINAEGVHVWPFDVACPMDVVFLMENGQHKVRMNRHPYFEVLYLCSGSAICHIQDRFIPMRAGDLVVIGSTLYHRIECRSSTPVTIAALFFEPDMIRCDGASDSAEYLAPFLLQDEDFPHIVPADTGVPRQVLDLMLRVR